ncbi:MAG: hypothetical protein ACFFD4_38890 [Candidatus Odinarchaeota archaeon]
MSLIQMEAGSPHATAAKTFFSLCLVLLFYDKNLSFILREDLQTILFWTGALLLVLSVIAFVEWILHGVVYIFYDKNLHKKAFKFWKTLNQPQWDQFLNDVTGDIYLACGLSILSIKLFLLEPGFFDEPVTIPVETINLLALLVMLALVILIVTRLLYRIWSRRYDIELSQLFITLKMNKGNPAGEDYYLSKTWPLFRTAFLEWYNHFIRMSLAEKRVERLKMYSETVPENSNWFEGLFNVINTWNKSYNEKMFDYTPQLTAASTVGKLLKEIEVKLDFFLKLKAELHKQTFGDQEILLALRKTTKWEKLTEEKQLLLQKTINAVLETMDPERREKIGESVDKNWISSLYGELGGLAVNLEKLLKQMTVFIEKRT